MTLLLWIIVGLALGIAGYFLDNQEAKGGLLGALLFGLFGSFLGGFLARVLLGSSASDLSALLIVFSGGLFFLLLQRTIFSQSERF